MVAFYKCDNCGFKMKPGEMERLKLKYNDVGVEVIHSWKGTWNAGHVGDVECRPRLPPLHQEGGQARSDRRPIGRGMHIK